MFIWVACSVIVIFVGNGHGDQSSNTGQGCLDFHLAQVLALSTISLQILINSWADSAL